MPQKRALIRKLELETNVTKGGSMAEFVSIWAQISQKSEPKTVLSPIHKVAQDKLLEPFLGDLSLSEKLSVIFFSNFVAFSHYINFNWLKYYLNRRQPKTIPTKSDVLGVVSFTTGSCFSATMTCDGFSVFGTGLGLENK